MTRNGPRERIREVAADLFYRDGFHAVGLDRVVAAASTTKTTFYRYFESKETLILRILEDQERWWRRTFAARLGERGGDDPGRQLRALFAVLEEMFAHDRFNGCMFVNVSIEFPLRHDPIHQAAAEHRHTMEAVVRDLAVRAGVREPVELAQELALLMDAAFLGLQVRGDQVSLAAARRLAADLLERHLPPPADPGRRQA